LRWALISIEKNSSFLQGKPRFFTIPKIIYMYKTIDLSMKTIKYDPSFVKLLIVNFRSAICHPEEKLLSKKKSQSFGFPKSQKLFPLF
jgi:hypothetical protein